MAREQRVETVADLQKKGVLLVEDGNHGEYRPLPSEFVEIGTPFVRPDDLKGGRVDFPNCDRINDQAVARVRKGKGRAGDILFTHRATVGRIARAGHDAPNFIANPGVTIWRATCPDILDPLYLYFFMQTAVFMNQVWAEAGNTDTFPYVSLTQQRGLNISFPCIKRQRCIAHVLGALDDKIELNRRMGETLEEMARALFKLWFVEFDPVRAKTENRDPGLPKPFADLFPARLVVSELGDIPESWSVKRLDEMARFVNGLALQKYPPSDGNSLPVIKIAQLRSRNTDGADRASADLDPDYIVQDGDILFSWSGSLECVLWAGGPGALNQHLFKVIPGSYPRWLCYFGIHLHLEDFRHIAAGKATTMGHIQRHHLSDAKLAVPPPPLMSAVSIVMEPIIESLWRREVQSRTLAAIRDTLLPKLISGELRIGGTGDFVNGETG
jgi:type I restriction enzyme S subunit